MSAQNHPELSRMMRPNHGPNQPPNEGAQRAAYFVFRTFASRAIWRKNLMVRRARVETAGRQAGTADPRPAALYSAEQRSAKEAAAPGAGLSGAQIYVPRINLRTLS